MSGAVRGRQEGAGWYEGAATMCGPNAILSVRHILKGWSQNIQNIQSALITTPLACIGHFMVLKAVFGV